MSFHIIIVTHNSAKELVHCLRAIKDQQLQPDSVVVVDSGSDNTSYLENAGDIITKVIKTDNIGFARANNLGFQTLDVTSNDIVLFLNPDAFLKSQAISQVTQFFKNQPTIGCLTGKLLGFNIDADKATGLIDSTGIFRKWYGRWYDRGQGENDNGQYNTAKEVPAICGAFMCCRVEALQGLGESVFDEDFFMYKEDIELSLRLKKQHYKLMYVPEIEVYHCRGWSCERKTISHQKRYTSARNELLMYTKHPSPYIFWALAKYLSVRFLNF